MTFKDFTLSPDIYSSISKKGFTDPTEVQRKVIPLIFERTKDIVAIAQTGTGKTAAFGLPLVDLIRTNNTSPQVIILTPTRELALQVTKELSTYTTKKKLNILTVYGGASLNTQLKALKQGVDIVVGTPGRVVDMIKRKALNLMKIEYFVLDEADEMLNMGFIEDIEFMLSSTNKKKKVFLFSATMPQRIKTLSKKYMKDQVIVEIKQERQIHTELIDQLFYKVQKSEKTDAFMRIIDNCGFFYGIVFCKTKSDVEKLTRELKKNKYSIDCIHGDIAQNKRERVLQQFREMRITLLVATDVAARGIDVNNLTHVVNHSLPQSIETYTHRIGRTGRAGNKGTAVTLVTSSEMSRLTTLEKITGFKLRKDQLPVHNERTEKREKRISNEYGDIISSKKHKSYFLEAEKLMKQYNSKDLIAAFLYKENLQLQEEEKKEKKRYSTRKPHAKSKSKGNNYRTPKKGTSRKKKRISFR